ncbi:hypothetical protein GmHk_01G000233 [Glycine max]|nr:hypothetical protein GmHk_01G000233 [Glycine max]
MVKTRGLGRALGRIVARGLGRGDGDDSDGAPQHRRLTASARKRHLLVIVDDDVPAIPVDSPAVLEAEAAVVGDEPMDAVDEPEGFPGGTRDPSVLMEYADHVAASEHPELKLSSHGRKVHNLGRLVPAIEDMVAGTGLSPLIACSIDTGDHGLISSFVGEPLRSDEAVLLLVALLMVSPEVAMAEIGQCGGPYCWIYEHFSSIAECNADPNYDEVSPRACWWIATKKIVEKVSTTTYRTALLGACCCQIQTREGYAPVRLCPVHSCVHSWVSYDDVDDT